MPYNIWNALLKDVMPKHDVSMDMIDDVAGVRNEHDPYVSALQVNTFLFCVFRCISTTGA